jgi:non-ribosomal peptide synthetase component F
MQGHGPGESHLVITGFNTDVKYRGVVYHVQTEDKVTTNPLIETLVYKGGEILGSRRLPYAELVKDRATRDPDTATCEALLQACADQGLLVLNCGTHHNVIRLVESLGAVLPREGVWAQCHSYAFDVSAWEMWGALLRGE